MHYNLTDCKVPHHTQQTQAYVVSPAWTYLYHTSSYFELEPRIEETSNSLKGKVTELEYLIQAKDSEIKLLSEKVNELERKKENFCDHIFDKSESESNDSETSFDIQLDYECEMCDFTSKKEVGLKIHVSKMHKYNCDECEKSFEHRDQLERHRSAKEILSNISVTHNDELNLVIKKHLDNEMCLGIFSTQKPRDDFLPSVFLHSSMCWDRSGHTCPDLPEDLEADNPGNTFVDYNYYIPTLHCPQDLLVCGDTSLAGCFMDWVECKKMITENN